MELVRSGTAVAESDIPFSALVFQKSQFREWDDYVVGSEALPRPHHPGMLTLYSFCLSLARQERAAPAHV